MTHVFGHAELPAYQSAVELYGLITALERRLSRHDPLMTERLRQAAVSISVNIAAGAGAATRPKRVRRYRTALAAATECTALLDLFLVARPGEEAAVRARAHIDRLAAQLAPLLMNALRPTIPVE